MRQFMSPGTFARAFFLYICYMAEFSQYCNERQQGSTDFGIYSKIVGVCRMEDRT